jgi:4a-hydroxytetrahydrobiopterin dehydratase
MELLKRKCVPCEGGVPPLGKKQVELLLSQVSGWKVSEDNKLISKEFKFKDFVMTMKFVNQVADLAEEEGHHPDIHVYQWNHLRLELWTHAIGGLSDNDFIMAAKINALNTKKH